MTPAKETKLFCCTLKQYEDGDVGIVLDDDEWQAILERPTAFLVGPTDIYEAIEWLIKAHAYAVYAWEEEQKFEEEEDDTHDDL